MPLRGSVLRVLLLAAPVALCGACANAPVVAIDEDADFSHYFTWGWQPEPVVEAPAYDASKLGHRLAEAMEDALQERGLRRVDENPDLRVAVRLRVRSQIVVRNIPHALETLNSYTNASPTYEIQITEQEIHNEDYVSLELLVAERDSGRVVWQGLLEEQFQDDFKPHLKGVVSRLLERFPSYP